MSEQKKIKVPVGDWIQIEHTEQGWRVNAREKGTHGMAGRLTTYGTLEEALAVIPEQFEG